MTAPGGTEVHLVTIGDQLLRLGHEVVIYSPELDQFADHARRRGLDVFDELRELPEDCDVVFAQDGIVVYDLVQRYPQALSVFRVCGDVFDFQSPPQTEGLVDIVVVLSDRYARLAGACGVAAQVVRLRVPVDSDRLVALDPIRARPASAVILGNYPDRLETVREAWEGRGIEVRHVGGAQQQNDVAAALVGADIVVAKSRAALDAMACGRAVYVYDLFGGDGWVTPETYRAMEADNFAGQAMDRVIGVAELQQDLDSYDPHMGIANRDLIIQHHRARDHVIEFLAAVSAAPKQARPPDHLRELSRLTALQWSWERFARETQIVQTQRVLHAERVAAAAEQAAAAANQQLAAAAEQAAAEAEHAAAPAAAGAAKAEREGEEPLERANDAASLRAELEAIHASRAWRLANRYVRLRNKLFPPRPVPEEPTGTESSDRMSY